MDGSGAKNHYDTSKPGQGYCDLLPSQVLELRTVTAQQIKLKQRCE